MGCDAQSPAWDFGGDQTAPTTNNATQPISTNDATQPASTNNITPPKTFDVGAKRKPLGRLIGAFKTVFTKEINQMRNTPSTPIWQRNYYEHII
jgi:putative transposase